MKKIIISLATILLLTGCTSDLIKKAYTKTLPSEKGINGYTLDVRISEKTTDGINRESIRIKNYMNKNFSITLIKKELEGIVVNYIIDNQKHVKSDNVYIIEENDILYDQPKLYLELLNNIIEKSKVKEIKLGNNTYKMYDVVFNKNHIKNIVEDMNIVNKDITQEVTGKIYIDKDNYVYRIDVDFNEVDLLINFFGFDKVGKIQIRN